MTRIPLARFEATAPTVPDLHDAAHTIATGAGIDLERYELRQVEPAAPEGYMGTMGEAEMTITAWTATFEARQR